VQSRDPGALGDATVANEPQAPYGDMKNSGYGRFDSRAVLMNSPN
jgi:hypothetical protein